MDRDRLVGETAYEHRLVANLPSMLAYWDANLRCRFANQAYRHWFGVDPNSLVGTSLRDLLGPELFALNEPHIRAVLSGQEQLFERSVPGPGGVTRESLANYVPDIVEGTVVGFLVQVMDITKVKATHDALKEAEEYLRQLFELSHEGILVADEAGRYTDVNDSCCHMLGYARTEIIGKTFEDLLAPSELHRLPTARAEMLAGGVHVQEWMLLRRDGTALPVEVRARRLSDGRRVGLLLDITDHKRILAAERATAMQLEETVAERTAELRQATNDLQVSEARLRGIFDSASEGIITTDANQIIVEANAAAARMFRCQVGDMLGTSVELFIPQRYRAAHAQEVHKFGEGTSGARPMGQQEVVALRADGQEFPIEASISQVTVGSQKLFTVIHRDVTSQAQMLADLRSAHAELEKLVSAMDRVQEDERKRISREIHDDLQQTLTAIKMNVTAIALAHLELPSSEHALLSEVAALADTAMDSTRRIIRDLRPPMIDELGLVAALESLANQTAQRHRIECRVDVSPNVSTALQQKPSITTCLYRVTQEALNNVVRHANATRVDITLEDAPGGQVLLRICDDGVGLLDADRKKAGSFGLLGMRERVRALGGRISIHGSPANGTTVEVTVSMPSAQKVVDRSAD
ncbi:hypothetical protein ASC76_06255 [Rhizobacter sp. Root404]|nr:hypothetical protein ASC76_06255 [Rhizobacter sp. Root404]